MTPQILVNHPNPTMRRPARNNNSMAPKARPMRGFKRKPVLPQSEAYKSAGGKKKKQKITRKAAPGIIAQTVAKAVSEPKTQHTVIDISSDSQEETNPLSSVSTLPRSSASSKNVNPSISPTEPSTPHQGSASGIAHKKYLSTMVRPD